MLKLLGSHPRGRRAPPPSCLRGPTPAAWHRGACAPQRKACPTWQRTTWSRRASRPSGGCARRTTTASRAPAEPPSSAGQVGAVFGLAGRWLLGGLVPINVCLVAAVCSSRAIGMAAQPAGPAVHLGMRGRQFHDPRSADEIRESDIGTGAGLFEVRKIGDEFYTFIVDCKVRRRRTGGACHSQILLAHRLVGSGPKRPRASVHSLCSRPLCAAVTWVAQGGSGCAPRLALCGADLLTFGR